MSEKTEPDDRWHALDWSEGRGRVRDHALRSTQGRAANDSADTPDADQGPRPPLQFGIRTILAATGALAVLLGCLRWIDAAPKTLLIVAAVIVLAAAAATAFAASLSKMSDHHHDSP